MEKRTYCASGAVWIRAASVEITGTISAAMVRIDAHEVNYSGSYISEDRTGIPSLLQISRSTSVEMTLTINSHNSQNMAFTILE